jgi:hypothetical protein
MSYNIAPIPPQTRYKAAIAAPSSKKPQKDPTNNESTNNDALTKAQAISLLTAKEYLTPGNPITLQVLAHVISQLGSAASKMPKAFTDAVTAVVVLVNDYATQQVTNDIVAAVTTHLQEHLDTFSSNVETMRDAVEHVTIAAKDITGKLNEFNDGFHESAEQLAQATQELTDRTSEKAAPPNSQTNDELGIAHYLKSYANITKQQVPPAHAAIIAKGEQSAKQILVQKDPKSTDNALSDLTEKELVAKANTTLELMDTEALEMPPGVAFVGAKKLRNGNVLYQLNTHDAGNWIKSEDVQKVFMESYGGTASMQNKIHYVIAEFVPITFIEDSSFIHSKIEEESAIPADSLVFSKYIKPAHLRSNNQKVAHVTLGFNSKHSANEAIQAGLFIEGKHVDVRKKLTEPRRCLKCQKFGHFVLDCKATEDTCARCNGKHRTSTCKETNTANFACSNCIGTNAKGHGAADRRCPAFKTELDKLHNRVPDNKYKYFPTSAPRTWSLLNETDNPMEQDQDQRKHSNPAQHNHHHPRSQHNDTNEWQSTRRGRQPVDKLTYQDRHYTPQPRDDTYFPEDDHPPRPRQPTLDDYVNKAPSKTQPRQRSNTRPPATSRNKSSPPSSRHSSEPRDHV